MTQQKAKVTRLLDGGRAEVSVHRKSACGHDCATCGGGCSELMVQPNVTVVAENPMRAVAGDLVTLESSSSRVLGVAALVYLLPLALFFLAYFLGLFAAGEGVATAAGVAGFALGLVLAWRLDRRMRGSQALTFRITAIERAL